MNWKIYLIPLKDRKTLSAMLLGGLGLSLWQITQTILPSSAGNAWRTPLHLASGLAGFAVLLVLPGHLLRTVTGTASGGHEPFDWRRLADIRNGLLAPAFHLILVSFWSFLPVEMYLALASKNHASISPWAAALLAVFSLVYFPMAWLMAAVTGKIMPSLLPSNVIEPIFKTFKSYLIFLLPFWIVCLMPFLALLLWPIPVIGPLLASFIILYLWTCGMKMLGNFYHNNQDTLKWQ